MVGPDPVRAPSHAFRKRTPKKTEVENGGEKMERAGGIVCELGLHQSRYPSQHEPRALAWAGAPFCVVLSDSRTHCRRPGFSAARPPGSALRRKHAIYNPASRRLRYQPDLNLGGPGREPRPGQE
jgi:hypothetical protein